MIGTLVGFLSASLLINTFLTLNGLYSLGYLVYFIFSLLYIFIFVKKILAKDICINKVDIFVYLFIISCALCNYLFFSDYKFEGGHDQGVYAEHAYWIYSHKKFEIDSIYQNVLTFPGYIFSNNKIVNQFPPAYPLYLSYFNVIKSISISYPLASTFIYLLLLLSIYNFSKKIFSNKKWAIILVIFISTNYYVTTLYRSTYVETLSILFLLNALFCLLDNKKYSYEFGLLLVLTNCLIRSDGIVSLFMYFAIIFFLILKKKIFYFNKGTIFLVFFTFLFFALTYFGYLAKYNNFVLVSFAPALINTTTFGSDQGTTIYYNKFFFNFNYFISVFSPIGQLIIFLLIIILLLNNLKYFKKNEVVNILKVIVFICPYLFFIINPGIALYLPWYFRRLMFVFYIVPLFLFFYLCDISSRNNKNTINSFVIILIFFINIIITSSIYFYKEEGTLKIIESIDNIEGKTFVIIDRFGIEDIAGPLFFYKGINTIYDREPLLSEKLYKCLIGGEKELSILSSSYTPSRSLAFFNTTLDNNNLYLTSELNKHFINGSCDVRNLVLRPWEFKDYLDIYELCKNNNPPNTSTNTELSLYYYGISNIFQEKERCDNLEVSFLINEDRNEDYKSYIK